MTSTVQTLLAHPQKSRGEGETIARWTGRRLAECGVITLPKGRSREWAAGLPGSQKSKLVKCTVAFRPIPGVNRIERSSFTIRDSQNKLEQESEVDGINPRMV